MFNIGLGLLNDPIYCNKPSFLHLYYLHLARYQYQHYQIPILQLIFYKLFYNNEDPFRPDVKLLLLKKMFEVHSFLFRQDIKPLPNQLN